MGLGRGTAKYEYDAFGVADGGEPAALPREVWEIVSTALAGGRFRYEGEYLTVPTRVELRPRSDTSKINFYGAVGGSPGFGRGDGFARPPSHHDRLQQPAVAA